MKQAILITAYKDFDQLIYLIESFDENFNFYIHIDKKSKISCEEFDLLRSTPKVKYITNKFKVNWGGLNHLKSILLLSEKALLDDENKLFHLITGHDFPIKRMEHFNKLMIESDRRNFIQYYRLPSLHWKNGGLDRMELYNFYDFFDAKTWLGKKSILFFRKVQRKLGLKRKMTINFPLYGGSTYWTLRKEVLKYVIDFSNQNPSFLKKFRFTFCAEEIYFQSIILNSEYSKFVINDDLRFIDWQNGKSGSPAILNEKDYDLIISSNKLFARKIDSKVNKLLQMLNDNLNN